MQTTPYHKPLYTTPHQDTSYQPTLNSNLKVHELHLPTPHHSELHTVHHIWPHNGNRTEQFHPKNMSHLSYFISTTTSYQDFHTKPNQNPGPINQFLQKPCPPPLPPPFKCYIKEKVGREEGPSSGKNDLSS